MENPPFPIENTSTIGGFSIAMLVISEGSQPETFPVDKNHLVPNSSLTSVGLLCHHPPGRRYCRTTTESHFAWAQVHYCWCCGGCCCCCGGGGGCWMLGSLLFVVCRCLLLGGVWDVEFSVLEAVFLKYMLLHVVLRVLAGRNGDVMFTYKRYMGS